MKMSNVVLVAMLVLPFAPIHAHAEPVTGVEKRTQKKPKAVDKKPANTIVCGRAGCTELKPGCRAVPDGSANLSAHSAAAMVVVCP